MSSSCRIQWWTLRRSSRRRAWWSRRSARSAISIAPSASATPATLERRGGSHHACGGRGGEYLCRKSGGPVVALPGGEQAAVAVRPGVGGAAAERLLELVHDPVGELLRGGDQLEPVPVTVDGDDAPLGLREAGPRTDVLDAPADGGLVGLHVGAAEQHPAEALAAVGLPAGGAGGPRGAREQRVRHPVIAPPRPPREDGAAALAYRRLGTRLGLDGDRRLLLAPHAAAAQAANERFSPPAHWHLPATCVASRGSRRNSAARVRDALRREPDGRLSVRDRIM